MKISSRLNDNIRIAAPFLLAILLAIALTGTALATPEGDALDPGNPQLNQGNQQTGNQQTGIIDTGDPVVEEGGRPAERRPARRRPGGDGVQEGGGQQGGTTITPHVDAPFTPPADCIVAHAATPAQICPVGGGLQYYFIGSGGSQTGPWIQSLQRPGHAPFWCRIHLQWHQSLQR